MVEAALPLLSVLPAGPAAPRADSGARGDGGGLFAQAMAQAGAEADAGPAALPAGTTDAAAGELRATEVDSPALPVEALPATDEPGVETLPAAADLAAWIAALTQPVQPPAATNQLLAADAVADTADATTLPPAAALVAETTVLEDGKADLTTDAAPGSPTAALPVAMADNPPGAAAATAAPAASVPDPNQTPVAATLAAAAAPAAAVAAASVVSATTPAASESRGVERPGRTPSNKGRNDTMTRGAAASNPTAARDIAAAPAEPTVPKTFGETSPVAAATTALREPIATVAGLGTVNSSAPQPAAANTLAAIGIASSAPLRNDTLPGTGTAAFTAQISPPLDSPAFAPALGVQVSMLVKNGIGEARLNLNPAELGPIAVKIELDGRQAQVMLSADLAQTRGVLEQALPTLASAMNDAGFTLSGGGVSQQSTQQQPGQATGAAAPHKGGRAADAGGDIDAPATAPARSRGLVDLVA